MPDTQFVTVAKVGAITPDRGRAFVVGNRMVAVFIQNGEYFAIDDLCPHMGASLADGYVEEGTVSCPWHAWRFRICDGTWCDNPRIKVDQFPVRIVGDEIQVGTLPSAAAGASLTKNETGDSAEEHGESPAESESGAAGDDVSGDE